jgi:hypothetical protein
MKAAVRQDPRSRTALVDRRSLLSCVAWHRRTAHSLSTNMTGVCGIADRRQTRDPRWPFETSHRRSLTASTQKEGADLLVHIGALTCSASS